MHAGPSSRFPPLSLQALCSWGPARSTGLRSERNDDRQRVDDRPNWFGANPPKEVGAAVACRSARNRGFGSEEFSIARNVQPFEKSFDLLLSGPRHDRGGLGSRGPGQPAPALSWACRPKSSPERALMRFCGPRCGVSQDRFGCTWPRGQSFYPRSPRKRALHFCKAERDY